MTAPPWKKSRWAKIKSDPKLIQLIEAFIDYTMTPPSNLAPNLAEAYHGGEIDARVIRQLLQEHEAAEAKTAAIRQRPVSRGAKTEPLGNTGILAMMTEFEPVPKKEQSDIYADKDFFRWNAAQGLYEFRIPEGMNSIVIGRTGDAQVRNLDTLSRRHVSITEEVEGLYRIRALDGDFSINGDLKRPGEWEFLTPGQVVKLTDEFSVQFQPDGFTNAGELNQTPPKRLADTDPTLRAVSSHQQHPNLGARFFNLLIALLAIFKPSLLKNQPRALKAEPDKKQ